MERKVRLNPISDTDKGLLIKEKKAQEEQEKEERYRAEDEALWANLTRMGAFTRKITRKSTMSADNSKMYIQKQDSIEVAPMPSNVPETMLGSLKKDPEFLKFIANLHYGPIMRFEREAAEEAGFDVNFSAHDDFAGPGVLKTYSRKNGKPLTDEDYKHLDEAKERIKQQRSDIRTFETEVAQKAGFEIRLSNDAGFYSWKNEENLDPRSGKVFCYSKNNGEPLTEADYKHLEDVKKSMKPSEKAISPSCSLTILSDSAENETEPLNRSGPHP